MSKNWYEFYLNKNDLNSFLISAVKPIECSDFKKQVPSGYPYIFYHATSDVNSVCSKGLLPSAKINASGIKSRGLGQSGELDVISFTTDKFIGYVIAKDLITCVKISNGELNYNNFEDWLNKWDDEFIDIKYTLLHGNNIFVIKKPIFETDKYNPTIKGYLHKVRKNRKYAIQLYQKPSEIWKKMLSEYDLDYYKKGYVRKSQMWYGGVSNMSRKSYPTWNDLLNDYPDAIKTFEDKNKPNDNTYYSFLIKDNIDLDANKKQLLYFFKDKYLFKRQEAFGKHNPYFSGSEETLFHALKLKKETDIGLLEYDVFLPFSDIDYNYSADNPFHYASGVRSLGKY
jgi:hypothetical protein